MRRERVEVRKFRKLIKEMYRGFPNWVYWGMVEGVIRTETMLKALIDEKFLMKETYVAEGNKKNVYMLGPNALSLVSAWETEDLTKSIRKLTWAIITMTGVSLIILIMQTLKIFEFLR